MKSHEVLIIFLLALATSVLVPGVLTNLTADKQDIRYTLGN